LLNFAGKIKFVVLIGDGMGDYPQEALGGRTPLEAARTPNLDLLANKGVLGRVATIPEGMEPGSDIANLSVLGYDPRTYHSGRAPLEAAGFGITLAPRETAFRLNLVTLSFPPSGEIIMEDYSAGQITTGEARVLLSALKSEIGSSEIKLYTGVSYRHLLIWQDAPEPMDSLPPHDYSNQDMRFYLERTGADAPAAKLVVASWEVLKNHPINQKRLKEGKSPANSIWLWGQGKAPQFPGFKERFGLEGSMISAVNLLKGIAVYLGIQPLEVPGATGYLDTNYRGKVQYGLTALKERDFLFLHIEAPDEVSHEGDLAKKIAAIEAFDREVVGPLWSGLKDFPAYALMVLPDHYTPILVRTHTKDPVPFACYYSFRKERSGTGGFSEPRASAGGIDYPQGHRLMGDFLKGLY
jgi:2,3-bisphosphoglycerate-independent phosphoglycerate mutase